MTKFEVYEDNGGGLYLFVFDDDDEIVFAHEGYEYVPGQLRMDIIALLEGKDTDDWDGHNQDLADNYQDKFKDFDGYGLELIATEDEVWQNDMGAAAQREFKAGTVYCDEASFSYTGHYNYVPADLIAVAWQTYVEKTGDDITLEDWMEAPWREVKEEELAEASDDQLTGLVQNMYGDWMLDWQL